MVRVGMASFAVLLGLFQVASGEVNCHDLCNQVRGELNAGIPCRQYRKTLPRPKVGNACRTGYEEAVTDACFATCTGEAATNVVSQACRPYRAAMPKPVMFNSCETGYNAGFTETQSTVAKKLQEAEQNSGTSASKPKSETPQDEPMVVKKEPTASEDEVADQANSASPKEEEKSSKLRGDGGKTVEAVPVAEETVNLQEKPSDSAEIAEEPQEVIATLPVNIDDQDIDLVIHRNEDPSDAVKRFCAEHMAESGDACETQLLPHVLSKLQEKGMKN